MKFNSAALSASAALLAASAFAQSWPARPVQIVAPFSAGGAADTLGRLAAQKLSDAFKQPFVVQNRDGAGGLIGSELVARSAPDGYTLVVSSAGSHVIAPALSSKATFDPLKDFTHIALLGGIPSVLAISPSLPAKDLKEFIALAKSRPGQISYGSPGHGSFPHFLGELIKQVAGIDMQHVPYKGASGAVADLIGGHIGAISTTLATAAGQIKAGKARALAVSSENRLADYPDVPTFRELGYPDVVASLWFSLSGPAGVPADIVNRLNLEVRRAMQAPDVRERLRHEGIEPGNLDPQAFTAFFAAEIKRWVPMAKALGAKSEGTKR
ncbi:MAG: tripartite tricarboxylate transporter substrate binding protein [Betaproteobacteria bacterium]|nr:tripartite tricarboxylate transporter substrate binding protein [Betaproteobacteria bacterium]